MSAVVLAKAIVTRTGRRFTRNNYTVSLTVNGIPTGLHVHCGRKDRKEASAWMVDNTAELLEQAGMLDAFIALAGGESDVTSPAIQKGDKVKLLVELGPKYPVGTKGTIVRVDEEENVKDPENHYPYLFAPDGMPGIEIPLGRGECEASV